MGFRLPGPPEPHYTDIYELTDRTEHLKRMVGGILPWSQLDGPNVIGSTSGGGGTGAGAPGDPSAEAAPAPSEAGTADRSRPSSPSPEPAGSPTATPDPRVQT